MKDLENKVSIVTGAGSGIGRAVALLYAASRMKVVIYDLMKRGKKSVESQEVINSLVVLHPIGRLGEPEEVAELVLLLSSSNASFITGAYYAIDGGYLSQ